MCINLPVHPTSPFPLGIHTFVFYTCIYISALWIRWPVPIFFRFHIYALIYNICFSLSDLLHSVWQSLVWSFLKKLKIELPYDTAIPLLGIYQEKNIIQKDTCTPLFIAATFTTARIWTQPKCPSTEEWIKRRWYKHTM